jgi:hypothetical protein
VSITTTKGNAVIRRLLRFREDCQVQADQGRTRRGARNILAYVSTPRPKANAEMRRTSQFREDCQKRVDQRQAELEQTERTNCT